MARIRTTKPDEQESLQWFRAYTEMVDDEKLRLLAFEDRWHFVALLCLKGSGLLDQHDPPSLRTRKIALKLGVQLEALEEIQRRLSEVGLIDEDFNPLNWGKRQFRSDHSTERVKKHRQKKKDEQTGNGNVTLHETEVKQDVNAGVTVSSKGSLISPLKIPPLDPFQTEAETETEADTPRKNLIKESSSGSSELAEKSAISEPIHASRGINGSRIFLQTCKLDEKWEVPNAKILEWEESYPDVDVRLTLLGIRQYLRDNPRKRKTAIGMTRFCGAWMMREQDKPDGERYAQTKTLRR